MHRPRQAGISGGEAEGADSIVLSGGYEDDEDHGDVIIYTGHGGRDPDTGQQVGDQLLTRQNLALAVSCHEGLPVRVVRGSGHRSKYAPQIGYRYDGLYRVERYWHEAGRSGHIVWRYRLTKIEDQAIEEPTDGQPVVRAKAVIQRIKELYDFQCQICGSRLVGAAGPYAEAAHIRPLGRPHNGADSPGNLLCLCPNDHVLLDYGGIAIMDDLSLFDRAGSLTVCEGHEIDVANLRYHRIHFFNRI